MDSEAQLRKEKNAAFANLGQHLEAIQDDPETPQDIELFKTVQYVLRQRLGDTIPIEERIQVITQIYHVLPYIPNVSEELLSLLGSFMNYVPVYRILEIKPPIHLASGLHPEAGLYNNLTLDLLSNVEEKAARHLATHARTMFEALVTLWLTTKDIGISSKANNVLLKLIQEGKEAGRKRFFRDSDVYGSVFEICSSKGDVKLDRNSRSIAQARLLTFMIALSTWNWDAAEHSHIPEVESKFGLKSGEGLLDFATRYATDYDADVLLHRTLIQSFSEMLNLQKTKPWTGQISPALQFLTSRKLHQQTMRYFLNPKDKSLDPIDVQFLYTESTFYARTFVYTHPNLISNTEELLNPILKRLQASFASTNWSSPAAEVNEDLGVLTRLPRACLNSDIPDLLSLVPYTKPNPRPISSLAQIFHGPEKSLEVTIPPPSENAQTLDICRETQVARLLFERYFSQHPDLFTTLVDTANKFAFPVVCITCIEFIHAIVNPQWDDPMAGIKLIMNDNPSRTAIIAFLLGVPARPQSTGDGHDAAIQNIAEVRFTLVNVFADKLKAWGKPEWAEIEQAVRRRAQAGVWGRPTNVTATLGR